MSLKRTGLNSSRKPLQSNTGLQRKPIPKKGPRAIAWQNTRAEKVKSDVDEEGLIRCEDFKLGLPRCGIARQPEDMDLHHAKGRDGNLLTDKRFLVWLTRECHDEAHRNHSTLTDSEASNDQAGPMD